VRRFLIDELHCYRLRESHQFKREIWGSENYLIAGIDVAKDRHRAFFRTATGKRLLRRLISLAMTIRGSESFWVKPRPCGCGMV